MSEPITAKPITATFRQLAAATADMHLWNRRYLSTLHDLWLKGAPTPDSIIRSPKGYDPRKAQAGNFEARLILPTQLARWIEDVTAARGMPLTYRQSLRIAQGEVDYGFDTHTQVLFDLGSK